jgi:hypothetical protein
VRANALQLGDDGAGVDDPPAERQLTAGHLLAGVAGVPNRAHPLVAVEAVEGALAMVQLAADDLERLFKLGAREAGGAKQRSQPSARLLGRRLA